MGFKAVTDRVFATANSEVRLPDKVVEERTFEMVFERSLLTTERFFPACCTDVTPLAAEASLPLTTGAGFPGFEPEVLTAVWAAGADVYFAP